MKKSEFITVWLQYWLQKKQIEDVMCSILWLDSKEMFLLEDIEANHLYEIQKAFYQVSTWQPEAYIYKKVEFWGNEFYIDERVLIPRNDTEILVGEAIQEISKSIDTENTSMLDIGTGSSCIPISIMKAISPLQFQSVYVTDISSSALSVSSINLEKHGLEKSVKQVQGSLLDAFGDSETYKLASNVFITANLPYVKDNDFENMDMSVVDFEPEIALYGGEKTGFELYETLIKQCFQLKKILNLHSITLFIEIGFDQHEVSKNFLEELWLRFEYFQDTHRINRVIKITNF